MTRGSIGSLSDLVMEILYNADDSSFALKNAEWLSDGIFISDQFQCGLHSL